MTKTGAKLAWPCMNITHSRSVKMSDHLLPTPPHFFLSFFPLDLKAAQLTHHLSLCPVFVCYIDFVQEKTSFLDPTHPHGRAKSYWKKKLCSVLPAQLLNYLQLPQSPKTKQVYYQLSRTLMYGSRQGRAQET